jgi:hypothetical protein
MIIWAVQTQNPDQNPRPDLPKRLAATVRAAQAKVSSARGTIEHYQERIRTHGARVTEYDANPHALVLKHYAGHAVGSYPVVTNIDHHRECLGYYSSHLQIKVAALTVADDALRLVEIDVLDRVTNMTKSSPGRVPWPKHPPSRRFGQRQMSRSHRLPASPLVQRRGNSSRRADPPKQRPPRD